MEAVATHPHPVEASVPEVRVRTTISRPDRRNSWSRIIDWNNRAQVHAFARTAREALLAGGSVLSERLP